jgi:hypothetical protein
MPATKPPPTTTSSAPPAVDQPRPATTVTPSPAMPPVAPPGGGPELSSISPASGAAGQVVVVSGANLMSADAHILARFNGADAPTRCQTQTSCTVTVPSLGPVPPNVTVTVTTVSGTSNALTFLYH